MGKTEEFLKPKITYGDTLRFTAYAYSKLLWMRDRGDTEIAGYCITGTPDPLLVTDFRLIKQECTIASFDLNPDDSAEFLETMLDEGLMPWQCQRILGHTHPGNSPQPSGTDEANFKKVFSSPDWAIMFIIAEGGAAYCRLKVNIGPGVVKEIKVAVDFKQSFLGTDTKAWEEEYKDKVKEIKFHMTGKEGAASDIADCFSYEEDQHWYDAKENKWCSLSQAEQDEFNRDCESQTCGFEEVDCFWDDNGNVAYWDDEEIAWFYYNPTNGLWYTDAIGKDDSDNEIIEVAPPHERWVTQVVVWANTYADERSLSLEDAS